MLHVFFYLFAIFSDDCNVVKELWWKLSEEDYLVHLWSPSILYVYSLMIFLQLLAGGISDPHQLLVTCLLSSACYNDPFFLNICSPSLPQCFSGCCYVHPTNPASRPICRIISSSLYQPHHPYQPQEKLSATTNHVWTPWEDSSCPSFQKIFL